MIDGYTDLELIGEGGFAKVYRAYDERLKRPVAIKMLNVPARDDEGRDRLLRESRAMGTLSFNPNIVTLYRSGVTPQGHLYLVMQLCERGSVGQMLKERARNGQHGLPLEAVLGIGIAVADALQAAHDHQLVHGDVKPANILLSSYSPLLTDFGIATFITHAGGSRATGVTLQYSAPEVLRWEPASPTSDLYSLGATLFALIEGHPPFVGLSRDEVLARILDGDQPQLEPSRVPPTLVNLVHGLMAPDPSVRQPRSAKEVHDALTVLRDEMFAADDDPTVDLASLLAAESASASGGSHEGTPAYSPSPVVAEDPPGSSTPVSKEAAPAAPLAPPMPATGAAPRRRRRGRKGQVDPTQTIALNATPPEPKNRRRMIVGAIAVVLVPVGGFIGYQVATRDQAPLPTDDQIVKAAGELAVISGSGPAVPVQSTSEQPQDLKLAFTSQGRIRLTWTGSADDDGGYVIFRGVFEIDPGTHRAKSSPSSQGFVAINGETAGPSDEVMKVPPGKPQAELAVDLTRQSCFKVADLRPGGLVVSAEQVCVPVDPPAAPEIEQVVVSGGAATVTWASTSHDESGFWVLELTVEGGLKVIEQTPVGPDARSASLPAHPNSSYVVAAVNAVNASYYPMSREILQSGWSLASRPTGQ